MRRFVLASVLAMVLAAAPAAQADCVNSDPARIKAAQDEARRKPLTAAELGMPDLDGLARDYSVIGDPRCSAPNAKPVARYTLEAAWPTKIASLYPYIRRRTEEDGMKRLWFANPMKGDDIVLTSGTTLTFLGGRTVNGQTTYSHVMIKPTTPPGALTKETQPYSVQDIVEGSPWPGGGGGKREFVRAD